LLFSAAQFSSAACVCRPASAACWVHAPVAAEPGDFPPADELAVAQPAEDSGAAGQARSGVAEQVRYAAADDSSPADSAEADSAPDEHSAAPLTDARCALAAPRDDSCPVDCWRGADYSVPDGSVGSVVPRVVFHYALAARTNGCPADYSAPAGLAVDDSPDSDSVQVDWVAAG
jgi:hypothetical protein